MRLWHISYLPAGASAGLVASVGAAAGAAAGAAEVSAGLSVADLVGSASVLVFLDFFLKAALSLALRLSRAPRATKKNPG